ncbi:MAG: 23S rRNA (uracil(1939)-C(5))-methyltransferase RlmD [Clostridium sp.]|nr:23S rRNA (uracil(1939)-C(5))-methyltransferase RlmD [Clostridium sp.]
MLLEKNQEFELTIEDMGNEGEGIGHIDGMAVFVKDTVPGDIARIKLIKVKKNYAYGRLMEVICPSAYRVEPICPHARRCGGCTMMHVSYEQQLAWKQDKVKNCLQRIGGIADIDGKMEPIIGMEEDSILADTLDSASEGMQEGEISDKKEDFPAIRYRNKAQFPVRRDKEGKLAIGFYAGRTHSVIDTDKCYLQDEVNDEMIKRFRGFMEQFAVEAYDEEQHTGLVRHILTRVGRKTGEVMICLVINGGELTGRYRKKVFKDKESVDSTEGILSGKTQGKRDKNVYRDGQLINVEQEFVKCMADIPGMTSISLNVNEEKTNRILGTHCRTIWGKDYITDYIGEIKYQISPLSFYQVNPKQTEKLYRKALEYADLQGNEIVWDLYCGIGTISLFLAQKAKKVCGVEIVPEAIEDARTNAKINGIRNVEFFVGKAEEILPEQYAKTGEYADVIVVDPPRKGCDTVVIDTMIQMAPKRIVYVSCDPATLARDVKMLAAARYEVERVCAVDQFSHGRHVETVCVLNNKNRKPDDYLKVNIDVDKIHDILDKEKEAKEKSQSE